MPSVADDRQFLFESIGININRIDLKAAAVIDKARPAPEHDPRQPTSPCESSAQSYLGKTSRSPRRLMCPQELLTLIG